MVVCHFQLYYLNTWHNYYLKENVDNCCQFYYNVLTRDYCIGFLSKIIKCSCTCFCVCACFYLYNRRWLEGYTRSLYVSVYRCVSMNVCLSQTGSCINSKNYVSILMKLDMWIDVHVVNAHVIWVCPSTKKGTCYL